MATSSRLNLTRDQLASFLQDHEQIKQFERLFASVNELVPTTIADLVINTGNADQKAVQALDALKRIADALELLATAPVTQPQISQDDLTPPMAIVPVLDDLTPPAERHNSIDYVDFNPLGPVPADKTGRVYWSDDDATLDVMLEGGVTGQVCQQLDFHPKNTSGVQINKGQAVMATGVIGASTKITCAKAVANGSVLPQFMLGIAAQDIPANSFGYVVWFGIVRGFNTTGANKTVPETWVDGDVLYFDPAYPGELTKVEPVAPNLDLPIAIVTNAANNGAIFVRMKTGEKLDELHDVHAPTPAAGDLLVYDAVDARWENAPSSSLAIGTATNLAGGLAGSVPYQSAPSTTAFLGIGAANTVMTSSGTAPQWSTSLINLTQVVAGATAPAGSSQITAYGATNGQLAVQNSTNWSRLLQNGNDLFIDNGTGGSGGNVIFRQGSGTTERMRLDSSGNLGIGTGGAAGAKLEVYDATNGVLRLSGGSGGGSDVSQIDFFRIGSSVISTIKTIRDGSNTSASLTFFTASSGTNTERMRLNPSGNLGLGTTSFGASAARVLALGNAVEPTSGPADTVQFYSVDRSAGNTIPAFYCEGSGVTNAGITSTAVTHKIAMKINGTIYYLLATTNAT